MKKFAHAPASVTILTIIVLILSAWYAIRVYNAIYYWQILAEYGANPVYILGSGVVWGLAAIWLAALLLKGYRRCALFGSMTAFLYFSWYWFDRLVIQQSPSPNGRFNAVVSSLFLAVFILLLNLPASKSFFSKESG